MYVFSKKPIKATRLFSFQFEKVLNDKSYLLQMTDFTTMKVWKSQEAVAAQDCFYQISKFEFSENVKFVYSLTNLNVTVTSIENR